MRGFLEIDLETNFTQLVSDLNATEPQVKKAMRSTLNKMATWLRGKSARGLSKELDVPLQQLRRRIRGFNGTHRGVLEIKLWYGLDPISMIDLGTPRKTSTGVTVRRRKIQGGFVAQAPVGDRQQIFKRRGKSRLPIDRQVLDINEKAQVYIEDEVIGALEFESKFFTLFEHELRWRTRTQK